jgi:hypothetical protein
MAEPGDQVAPGARGRGHLRAAHADREQVIGTLKAAFVAGMLSRDEFDLRVGQAFRSRTYAELAALTADLRVGLAAQPPEPARAGNRQPVVPPGRVLATATALYAGVWGYAAVSPNGGDNPLAGALVSMGAVVYLGILLICVGAILANLRERRSGGQPPRRPDARGPASRYLPPSGTAPASG